MSDLNIPHSKRIQDILKTSCLRSPFFPAVLCALFLIQLSVYTIRFMIALYRIDFSILPHGVLSQSVMLILPVLVWTTGTCADFFNFYRFKVTAYATAACSEALLFTAMAFQLLSRLFLPSILSIRTDEIFTKDMVLFLARLAVELPLLPFFLLLMKGFLRPLRETESRNVLLAFKLSHYLPGRKTACEIRYPLSIARDIATGKYIAISEKDRFLHTLVDGTSGTGKTSSTILPAIKNDLDMRCMAEQKQMSAMWELVQKGIYTYTGNDSFFSLSHFKYTAGDLHGSDLKPSGGSDNRNSSRSFGRPSSSDMLEELRLRYPVCGITVMAPEDSLTDDVCRLCDRRHIPYHRIDATPAADGKPKSSWTGMNPFFISPMLSGDALHQAIVKKAVIFSDVMQVITDLKGKADSYFTGLNRQMLANLAILVMNTVPPLQNRQATPADLQMLINNFDLLPPYVAKLEELDRKQQRYSFILQYIRDDLLGKGRAKMEDQSRGTRNIINEFLLMPGSREVYCAQTSIDFDRILKNGEITVCNYDLASGDSNAVAFGLFFLLSFNNAVLSRPGTEKTRTPHFFYIDELPVLIHSSLEKNFSLFRKFRVAMFCAIQTLDQFEKNEITKYLKGVILGCAHILVFGRSSLSDMEVFSSMAGVREEIEEQTSVSETALSGDSPALSYSSRETPVQKNTLEETDIRMRDFQEITFFTTQNGCPLPPLHAKVQFLSRTDWEPKIKQKLSVDSFRKYAVNVSETEHEIMPAAIPQTLSGLVSRYCQEEGFPDRAQSSENSVPTPSADPDASLCGTGSPSSQPRQAHIPDGSETLDGII